MRLAERKPVWDWIILIGLTAAAVAIAELIGLRPKWEDAAVYTVILFAALITALRPAWGRVGFWRDLLVVFVLHVAVVVAVLPGLPVGRFGIPKLWLFPAAMLEGLLILGVLWNRTARAKHDRSRA